MRSRPLGYEARLTGLALLGGAPAVLLALALLWCGDHAPKVTWTLGTLVLGTWLGCALLLRERVVQPLFTLANLLSALRAGDHTIRGRYRRADDALGGVMVELNALGDGLRALKVGALEATALLGKVMEAIDVALLAFDEAGALRLINRAGQQLFGDGALPGRSAAALRLEGLLAGEAPRLVDSLPGVGAERQWELVRSTFRLEGRPHTLVVLTDVQRALREEERQAWQRLIRVLGHEINNSLAPIQSIAGSLRTGLANPERDPDWEEDLQRGLEVIDRRAESLGRFLRSYARLARLPPPRLAPIEVGAWVARVVALEQRLPVSVDAGPALTLLGDLDQLEQLLINLVRNAVDAALPLGGGVEVSWRAERGQLLLWVRDEGTGLPPAANLFVPFFTTKPGGLGIGLVLCRQIAEAHGGSLRLYDRQEQRGCEARLMLPLNRARAPG